MDKPAIRPVNPAAQFVTPVQPCPVPRHRAGIHRPALTAFKSLYAEAPYNIFVARTIRLYDEHCSDGRIHQKGVRRASDTDWYARQSQ